MKIIGFDPGYGRTGWGVVTSRRDSESSLIADSYGLIETPAHLPLSERLLLLQKSVLSILGEYGPNHAVVEKLYMNKNLLTAAGVFQARGVILTAIASTGCEIIELAPNQIKQMVAGNGRATKGEVTRMVQKILNIREKIYSDDAADALAGAISGVFIARTNRLRFTASSGGRGKI